ncbi:MAG: DNA repair protein RecO [Coprobacillus sp.]|nr:DNA repair protein RecO [Coprobacillus sp.]
MKLIILSTALYKEKDGIVHAISEEGTIDFTVKSIASKSEKSPLNLPLSVIDATFSEGKNYKYPLLKEYELIDSPLISDYSTSLLVTISFLREVTTRLLPEDEQFVLYYPLLRIIDLIKDYHSNYYYIDLVYLLEALKFAGYEFNISECVYCGNRSSICDFSFDEGGFICTDCVSKKESVEFNKDEMLIIRYILRRLDDIDSLIKEGSFEEEPILKILNRALVFTSDNLGINLNSLKTLK